jgi:di/tricarboxylate transporter
MSIAFILGLLALLVVLMALEKPRADLAAMLALAALIVGGALEPGQAFSGFSNPATVAVAAMFVLSAGLESSGLIRWVGDSLLKRGTMSPTALLLLCALVIGPVSAFLNNTAAVAIFIPVVIAASQRSGISPSKVLMPLSFFAMLGGTCTLIGTSTNILVSSYAAGHGMQPFGMFEFSLLGMVLFGAGAIYLMIFAPRLTPERISAESLTAGHQVNAYLSEVVVIAGSALIGKNLAEARIGEKYDLEILSLYRDGQAMGMPGAERPLHEGDVLIIEASASVLVNLRDSMGLAVRHGRHPDDADLGAVDTGLVEIVIPPNSPIEGRTLKQLNFRQRYGAVVMAIRRHGADIIEKLGHIRLRVGDELLVLGRNEDLEQLRRRDGFVVLQELDIPVFKPLKILGAVLIIVGVIASAATRIVPIAEAAVTGSILMVLCRCLSLRKAYSAIDWKVIFLLAGLIPVGMAMENSGAAAMLVQGVIRLAGDFGPEVLLSAFYLLTALLTGFMSNAAAAVLLAPLAVTCATDLGVDPRPFLVAVTFAASAAFYTPIGYQTNLLVYSPGGYRFSDFLRLGGPLNIIMWLLASFLIPLFFPL